MATDKEVRAAAKRVQQVLDALKKAPAKDSENLDNKLRKAMDEYARLFRELRLKAG